MAAEKPQHGQLLLDRRREKSKQPKLLALRNLADVPAQLCINQNDLKEKAVQVAFMGRIFKTAQRVFACVGAQSEDSPTFMEIARLWPDILRHQLMIQSEPSEGWQESERQEFERRLSQHSEIREHEFCIASTNFFSRPYWHRLWIVQEIALARDITVVCGLDTLDWMPFSRLVLSDYISNKARNMSFRKPDDSEDYMLLRTLSMNNVEKMLRTRLGDEIKPLGELLRDFKNTECSNPLDRIYGFLHLIATRASTGKRIVPDYNQSLLRLALQCVELLYSDSRGLETYPQQERLLLDVAELLRALGIDGWHAEPADLIPARQRYFQKLSAHQSARNGITHEKAAQDAWQIASDAKKLIEGYCVCYARFHSYVLIQHSADDGLITHDPMLNRQSPLVEYLYSTALTYAEQQAAPGSASLSLKPRLLKGPENSTTILCGRAQPGDYCICLPKVTRTDSEEYLEPCLIVRRHGNTRMFEIIGQGYLSSEWISCPKSGPLTFYFSNEDVLAFVALDRWESDISREAWYDANAKGPHTFQMDRLFTSFTSRAFSSFAIEGR